MNKQMMRLTATATPLIILLFTVTVRQGTIPLSAALLCLATVLGAILVRLIDDRNLARRIEEHGNDHYVLTDEGLQTLNEAFGASKDN